jgi:hypothetical protein
MTVIATAEVLGLYACEPLQDTQSGKAKPGEGSVLGHPKERDRCIQQAGDRDPVVSASCDEVNL